MKRNIFTSLLFILPTLCAFSQTNNVVLIEEFTETGCGACSEYDSSYNVLTNANADKVAVLNYHCFYSEDPFTKYTKAGDQRYAFYQIKDGFPSAMVNGRKPNNTSAHLLYVTAPLINTMYNKPPQFKLDVNCISTGKGNTHSATIQVEATALKEFKGKNLRLWVVVTENNINYKERYRSAAVNGLNDFNHIVRAMLPDSSGASLGNQIAGNVNKVKVSFTNDDKEINYKEVRLVVFVQDITTKEVLGAVVTKESPFK